MPPGRGPLGVRAFWAGLGSGRCRGSWAEGLPGTWRLRPRASRSRTRSGSQLMSLKVFMGSYFVALSVFLYAFVGGLLLGPVLGTFMNRAVQGDRHAGGKEDLVVR